MIIPKPTIQCSVTVEHLSLRNFTFKIINIFSLIMAALQLISNYSELFIILK